MILACPPTLPRDAGGPSRPERLNAPKAARVWIRDLTVAGGHPRHFIRRGLRKKIDDYQACYRAARSKHPALGGELDFEVAFDSRANGVVDGFLDRIEVVASTLDSSQVVACVSDVLKRIEFRHPKCAGLAIVRFTMVFRPE